MNYNVSQMEDEASWDTYPLSHFVVDTADYKSILENDSNSLSHFEIVDSKPFSEHDNAGDIGAVSLDNIIPDDILERVFSFLPVACIFRVSSVNKRWYDIVQSRRFLWDTKLPQKPWYFMFTCNDAAGGYAYDPVLKKWYSLELPCIEKSNWFISSCCGLVCFMDNDSRSRIFICNPITRDWKRLLDPPGVEVPDYSTLAVSVERESHRYTVVVAKSKQTPGDFLRWDFSIHIYESECGLWVTSIREVLLGWRGGDESVICNGVLYCLIHCTNVFENSDVRHGLILYDLLARSSHTSLMRNRIPVPCPLTCGRLMNLKDRVVMVGGIAKPDRPDIIKGIGIWELHKKEWREIARMPHKYFQGFGELDDVFASSGSDDLIYIQSYGATALLVFDMNQKQWKWSVKCPVTKRFPLQLFSGFCFEPRLEATS